MFAVRPAPDETATPRGRPASLWPSWLCAGGGGDEGDGGGGCGGGTLEVCPHDALGSSHAGAAEVEEDDRRDEKGRDEAHDHQRTILRREDEMKLDKDGRKTLWFFLILQIIPKRDNHPLD